MRIVFMGTPDFAVETLKRLHEAGKEIVGVITVADKPAGRGKKIRYSAVKEYAMEQGLKILQPTNLKDEVFINELRELKADLQVVVAFRMLPEVVWNMPPKGTFNIHGSLLPQYRGAAPINWAVINGDKQTGVTSFFLDKEIDTGRIIASKSTQISDEDNAGTVHDRLMVLGADLALETVEMIEQGDVSSIAQEDHENYTQELKHAPKIFKQDCKLDFNQSCRSVFNKVRGLSPYPAAYLDLISDSGKSLYMKVFSVDIEEENGAVEAGTMLTDDKNYIKIACQDGFLVLNELQIQGKRRMPVKDFLRGYQFIESWKVN
jgi:methionyl-tRNA formyltransferase